MNPVRHDCTALRIGAREEKTVIDLTITQDTLESFTTEKRNSASMDIDTKDSLEILKIINDQDKKVPLPWKRSFRPSRPSSTMSSIPSGKGESSST